MKKYLLIILISSLIFASCDKFKRSSDTKAKDKASKDQKIELNKEGDTVLMNYKNGKLKSSVTVKNERRNGIAYNYYANGNVQFEINYKDGFKNGLVKYFYESGKIYRETFYYMGQKDGTQKIYYETGELKAEIPYSKDEVLLGTKEYRKSGNLINDDPKIVINPIDRLVIDNQYILKISLNPKKRDVRYYIYVKNDVLEGKIDLEDKTKNGIASHIIYLPPGYSQMEKIDFRAIIKTKWGNPKVIRRVYNLAIENRNY